MKLIGFSAGSSSAGGTDSTRRLYFPSHLEIAFALRSVFVSKIRRERNTARPRFRRATSYEAESRSIFSVSSVNFQATNDSLT